MKIAVIDYNAGNTRSVLFALERLGASAVVSSSAEEILSAERVVFPGVGSAGAAMKSLNKASLVETVKAIKAPMLGICLGLQLMCESSEEDQIEGLGIFSARVARFPEDNEIRVPHMGWNKVRGEGELFKGVTDESRFYFVHSYFAETAPETTGYSIYGDEFSSAMVKDNYYGVQFHPEKSGDVGELLLKNFLELSR